MTVPPVSAPLACSVSLLFFLAVSPAQDSPIRLNEILASNVMTNPDNTDMDDYSDWIELSNTSDREVFLDGHYLTDDLDEPFKWALPSGASIPPHGHLLIWADGYDAVPGETFNRLFSPWASFATRRYHANFKLSQAGEEVGLFRLTEPVIEKSFVDFGSAWRFLDDGSDPGNAWREIAFDDRSWLEGEGEFGYGEDDQKTTILSDNGEVAFVTTYFRTAFTVTEAANITSLLLELIADDGAVLYLNGEEITRVRMPEGDVDYLTFATTRVSGDQESTPEAIALPARSLREGENVLAVEVHQVANSGDSSFDLRLSGRRFPDALETVDVLTYGPQTPDVSLGRDPTDPERWLFFGEPTPGASNTTFPAEEPVSAGEVAFSQAGGWYDSPQWITLTTEITDGEIRYTLDGSWPTSASALYTDPVHVTETAPLRARVFAPDRIPGIIRTETYFIGEPSSTLPVISFVVDPEIFFDDTLGIYKNVYKGREAPVNLAYYEANGTLAFQVNAGAKIAGENIWRFAQKPMNIALRGKYGDDAIAYPLFPDARISSYSRFTLRNGGDNWDHDMLRDAMTASIMRGQMANDVEDYRPCVVYMNGRYWGIHNLRKNLDPNYFAAAYQTDPVQYDHVEYGRHTSNAVTLGAKEGDIESYLALEAYARDHDLADPEHYARMASLMDIDNFIDFICIEDFVNNTSWRHNREFWRSREPGAKWRWIVPDLDRGLNPSNQTTSLLDNFKEGYELFAALMENPGFKSRLAQRYAAHLASTFHPERIKDIVDRLDAEVRPEIGRHIERWKDEGGMASLESRQNELDEIKTFVENRAAHVYADFQENFDMPATVQLTLNVSPPEGGRILLNGVPSLPAYSDSFRLFRGLPADAMAEPAPGFAFAGWSHGADDARLDLALEADLSVTAIFEPSGETVLPPIIESAMTLMESPFPFTAARSITVPAGVTLTLEEGVTLQMPAGADLRVEGTLLIEGSEANPVRIESRRPGERWGAIVLRGQSDISRLSHLVVRGGSLGSQPVTERGAISIVGSSVEIDHLDIDDVLNPIFGWESNVVLRSSRLHTAFTGDGINVKHGQGLVEDCTFIGNSAPDTDAIDFDDVHEGVIRDNRIYAFRGPNSDGIDVGEGCVDLLVTGNRIYNCSDKGISVGQASTVRLERNLIVGCVLGAGIKDTGSHAHIDQNTFANCDFGVSVFEKNLGAGGGSALVTNSIFSRSKEAPVMADAHSEITASYSLSDTLPIPGEANLLADPLFADAGAYDFSVLPASPAIDGGDPAHAPDDDHSRADIGAPYVYDPEDYPYHVPNVIVINEILAHSENGEPDWIELHNSSNQPVDIGGWFLSDGRSDLRKYRIADGTVVPPLGFLVFYEDETFGELSEDPGKITPFALNENGDNVYLFAAGDGLVLDYLEEESFGPSRAGVSKGRHLKSTNTYNFVAMTAPTPGSANALPAVGPVVISEIMYHPAEEGDAEYLELTNITNEPLILYEAGKEEPWRFTDGVDFAFPTAPPVSMEPGERIVLVRNEAAFRARFDVPESTRIFQWADSGLNNGGEKVELSRPGDLDDEGARQWIRVDRVQYGDTDLWPVEADGGGTALARIDDTAYGNDVVNWRSAPPSPGRPNPTESLDGFERWAEERGLPMEASGPHDDADGDGITNGAEYAFGLDPTERSFLPAPELRQEGQTFRLDCPLPRVRENVTYAWETSDSLEPGSWTPAASEILTVEGQTVLRTSPPREDRRRFFRVLVTF